MKKEVQMTSKKLLLKKQTIVSINPDELNAVKGGLTEPTSVVTTCIPIFTLPEDKYSMNCE